MRTLRRPPGYGAALDCVASGLKALEPGHRVPWLEFSVFGVDKYWKIGYNSTVITFDPLILLAVERNHNQTG